jgi:PHP family Zn ribbon phosphoesterase
MRLVHADLHLHTVLSPCGGLDMGAPDIVIRALDLGIDILAVTDHNTSRNAMAILKAAEGTGLLVLAGIEVQSAEDIHAVTLFGTPEETLDFEAWLWEGFPKTLNRPDLFGPQILIDHENQILGEEPILLVQGARHGIDAIVREARRREGICFLSHIDREAFSYPAILGPIPPDYPVDALELTCRITQGKARSFRSEYPNFPLLKNSDAHSLDQMELRCSTVFRVARTSFAELRLALHGEAGRAVLDPWGGDAFQERDQLSQ